MLHVVLVEPEIPQNTGNISRTCAATGSVLHLIGPLGFSLDDKHLKRAGLDYWSLLDVRYYNSYSEFESKNINGSKYYVTTKAKRCYTDIAMNRIAILYSERKLQGFRFHYLKLRRKGVFEFLWLMKLGH
jgi:tRNA (cytidine/uridine-2'-O-)-methyltransferase